MCLGALPLEISREISTDILWYCFMIALGRDKNTKISSEDITTGNAVYYCSQVKK